MGDIFKFSDLLRQEQEYLAKNPPWYTGERPDLTQGKVADVVSPFRFPKDPNRIALDNAIKQAGDLKNSGNTVEIDMQDILKHMPGGNPVETASFLRQKGYQIRIPGYYVWDMSKPKQPASTGQDQPENYNDRKRWEQFYRDYSYIKSNGYVIDETRFSTPEQHMAWTVFRSAKENTPAQMGQFAGTSYARMEQEYLKGSKTPVKGAGIAQPPPNAIEQAGKAAARGVTSAIPNIEAMKWQEQPSVQRIDSAPLSRKDWGKIYRYAEDNGLDPDKLTPVERARILSLMTPIGERLDTMAQNLPEWDPSLNDSIAGSATPFFQKGADLVTGVASILPNAASRLLSLGQQRGLEDVARSVTGTQETYEPVGISKAASGIAGLFRDGFTDENMGKIISGGAETDYDLLAFWGPGAAKGFVKFMAMDEAANAVIGERPIANMMAGVSKEVSGNLQEHGYGEQTANAIGDLAAVAALGGVMKVVHGRKSFREDVSRRFRDIIAMEKDPLMAERAAAAQKAIDFGGIEKMATDAVDRIDTFILDNPEAFGRPDLARKIGDLRMETSTEENAAGVPNEPRFRKLNELTTQEQDSLSRLREEAMANIGTNMMGKGVDAKDTVGATQYIRAREDLLASRIADLRALEGQGTQTEPAQPAEPAPAVPAVESRPDGPKPGNVPTNPETPTVEPAAPPAQGFLRQTAESVRAQRIALGERLAEEFRHPTGMKEGFTYSAEMLAQAGHYATLWVMEKGLDFAAYSTEMIRQFGESIRPHLQQLYDHAMNRSGLRTEENTRPVPAQETAPAPVAPAPTPTQQAAAPATAAPAMTRETLAEELRQLREENTWLRGDAPPEAEAPAERQTMDQLIQQHTFETNRPASIEKYRANPDYTETDIGDGYFRYTPVNRTNDTGAQVLDRVENGFAAPDTTVVENAKQKKAMQDKDRSGSRILDWLVYSLFRTSERAEAPLEQIVRDKAVPGPLRTTAGEALNSIGRFGYSNEAASAITYDLADVARNVRDAGLTEREWNAYLALNRGINDPGRADMLTYGYTPEVMQRGMTELRTRLGEEKFARMQEIQTHLVKDIWQPLLLDLKNSGLISEDSYDKALENTAYAPFKHPSEYAPFRAAVDDYVAQIMKESVGSIGVSASPFTEMVVKAHAYTHMLQENNARRLVAKTANEMNDFLSTPAGQAIRKPGRFWMNAERPKNEMGDVEEFDKGMARPIPQPAAESGQGLLEYYENGQKKGIWIAKEIADHFNDKEVTPLAKVFQWNVLRAVNSFQRQVLTSRNPFFFFRNMPRDLISSVTQNEGMRLILPQKGGNFLTKFREQWASPDIKEFVKSGGKVISPRLKEAMKRGLISEHIQFDINPANSDSLMLALGKEAFLENAGQHAQAMGIIDKVWNALGRWNMRSEISTKMAGKEWYEQHRFDMPEAYRDYRVREYVGTPNARQKGKMGAVIDNVYMFSNIGFQGWRAAIKNLRQNPMKFAMKQLSYTVLPNAVKWLTYYGVMTNIAKSMFGDDSNAAKTFAYYQKALNKVGKYNLDRYYVVPSPFGFDDNNKAIVARIPMGHFDMAFSTLIGQMVKTIETDVKAGKYGNRMEGAFGVARTATIPTYEAVTSNVSLGLNPIFDIGVAFLQAMGGENPKDRFYDRNIFSREAYAANDELRKGKEMGGWLAGKVPVFSTWIYNPKHGTGEVHPSLPDVLARFPAVQSPLFNFVVTDAGENEEAAQASGIALEKKARNRLALDDVIDASLAAEDQKDRPDYWGGMRTSWQKAVKDKMIPKGYRFDDWKERYTAAAAGDEPKLKYLRDIPKEEQASFLENIGPVDSHRVVLRKSWGKYKIMLKR